MCTHHIVLNKFLNVLFRVIRVTDFSLPIIFFFINGLCTTNIIEVLRISSINYC